MLNIRDIDYVTYQCVHFFYSYFRIVIWFVFQSVMSSFFVRHLCIGILPSFLLKRSRQFFSELLVVVFFLTFKAFFGKIFVFVFLNKLFVDEIFVVGIWNFFFFFFLKRRMLFVAAVRRIIEPELHAHLYTAPHPILKINLWSSYDIVHIFNYCLWVNRIKSNLRDSIQKKNPRFVDNIYGGRPLSCPCHRTWLHIHFYWLHALDFCNFHQYWQSIGRWTIASEHEHVGFHHYSLEKTSYFFLYFNMNWIFAFTIHIKYF